MLQLQYTFASFKSAIEWNMRKEFTDVNELLDGMMVCKGADGGCLQVADQNTNDEKMRVSRYFDHVGFYLTCGRFDMRSVYGSTKQLQQRGRISYSNTGSFAFRFTQCNVMNFNFIIYQQTLIDQRK